MKGILSNFMWQLGGRGRTLALVRARPTVVRSDADGPGYMATADDLMTSAQRFYALARTASNPTTKLQLVSLGDDYFRQANELRRERMIGGRAGPQSEFLLPRL